MSTTSGGKSGEGEVWVKSEPPSSGSLWADRNNAVFGDWSELYFQSDLRGGYQHQNASRDVVRHTGLAGFEGYLSTTFTLLIVKLEFLPDLSTRTNCVGWVKLEPVLKKPLSGFFHRRKWPNVGTKGSTKAVLFVASKKSHYNNAVHSTLRVLV